MSLFQENFAATLAPMRVRFGAGARHLVAEEMERLGLSRALILTTPQQADTGAEFAAALGAQAVGVYSGAAMHTPVAVSEEATAQAIALGADCVVAVGGGSTTGLGKAIALESGLPILAIPTTYAGSEMTPIYGITEGGLKKTGKDPRVLPRTVIYDPELTLTLPLGMSVTSGMNAIAHAAEGLYAQDSNPVMDLMAEEGIRAIAQAIPAIRNHSDDIEGRSNALYGAWLCGTVLGNVGMALHHKLCHTLGGSFNLPHAEVHTVVVPQAIAFNAQAAPRAMQRIERAMGGKVSAAAGLYDLAKDNGAPVALRDIGMQESDLDRATDIALSNPYWNPRPFGVAERNEIRALLQRAFEGVRPD